MPCSALSAAETWVMMNTQYCLACNQTLISSTYSAASVGCEQPWRVLSMAAPATLLRCPTRLRRRRSHPLPAASPRLAAVSTLWPKHAATQNGGRRPASRHTATWASWEVAASVTPRALSAPGMPALSADPSLHRTANPLDAPC